MLAEGVDDVAEVVEELGDGGGSFAGEVADHLVGYGVFDAGTAGVAGVAGGVKYDLSGGLDGLDGGGPFGAERGSQGEDGLGDAGDGGKGDGQELLGLG